MNNFIKVLFSVLIVGVFSFVSGAFINWISN